MFRVALGGVEFPVPRVFDKDPWKKHFVLREGAGLPEYYDWLDQGQDLTSRDVAQLSKVAVQISLDLDPLVLGIFCSFLCCPVGFHYR